MVQKRDMRDMFPYIYSCEFSTLLHSLQNSNFLALTDCFPNILPEVYFATLNELSS